MLYLQFKANIIVFTKCPQEQTARDVEKRKFVQWAALTRMTRGGVRYSALQKYSSSSDLACSRAILPITCWVVSMQFI